MAINAKEYLEKLPTGRREAIKARADELIAEELSLAELRDLLEHSQAGLAKKMRVQQAEVSKIERRRDIYVSTLRRYVEAACGPLEIVVRIPNQQPVRLRFGAAAGRATGAGASAKAQATATAAKTDAPESASKDGTESKPLDAGAGRPRSKRSGTR